MAKTKKRRAQDSSDDDDQEFAGMQASPRVPAEEPEARQPASRQPREPQPVLPEHLETQRTQVICGPDINYHTTTFTTANMFQALGISNAWDHEQWAQDFRISVTKESGAGTGDHTLEFDMVNVDPALANAIRRVLLSEVATMAIEHVFFINNTSIISDEILAHRLGLIPLKLDPHLFEDRPPDVPASHKNTVIFRLKVACKRKVNEQGEDLLEHGKVYSEELQWLPEGSAMPDETGARFARSQSKLLKQGARPVEKHILLAKLRPGQAIDLEAHAIKGLGAEHAKWSPVATAWYKLRPEMVFKKEVVGQDADDLAAELQPLVSVQGSGGSRLAVFADACEPDSQRLLEKARRLSGEERWQGRFELRKHKGHFMFTIESTGAVEPHRLFDDAIDVLIDKCDKLLEMME